MGYLERLTDVIRLLRIQFIRLLVINKPQLPLPDVAVVFAPHPDDEVFGCSGLMQKMINTGRHIELVLMTGGGKSHNGCCDLDEHELIDNRRKLTRKAAAIYGLQEEYIHFLNYPDGSVSLTHEDTEVIKDLLLKYRSENLHVFYPHMLGEGWSDHVKTAEIVQMLCTSICPKAVQFEYCVWFWFYNCLKIKWSKAFTVKLSALEYKQKLEAIQVYVRPTAPCGKPWSGVLPSVFLWANMWKKELYFKKD